MKYLRSSLVRHALSEISQGVLIAGADRRIMFANAAFSKITCYQPNELIGRPCSIVQGSETDPAAVQEISERLAHLESFSGDVLNYRKTGEPFWNELTITPCVDPKSGETFFVGVTRDITRRKLAESELAEMDLQHKFLFDHAQAGLVLHGPGGEVLFANRLAQQLLGVDREEVLGAELEDPRWDFIRDDGSPMPVDEYPVNLALASRGAVKNFVLGAYRHSDKQLTWLMGNALAALDDDGAVANIVTSFTDVTELKQTELALAAANDEAQKVKLRAQSSETRYRFLADNISDVLIHITPEGEGLYSSAAMAKLIGYSPKDLAGKNAFDLIHIDDCPRVKAAVGAMSAKNPERTIEYRTIHRNGAPIWVEARLQYQNGGVVGVVRDITARKVLEAQIETALMSAQASAHRAEVAERVAGLGHWRFDHKSGELTWSRQLYEILGLDPSMPPDVLEIINRMHPDDRAGAEDRIAKVINRGTVLDLGTSRFIRPDGEIRNISTQWGVETDSDGTVTASIGTVMDLTDRVRIQDALAESEQKYRMLAENSTDIIVRFGPDGLLRYVSPACRILGLEADQEIGRPITRVLTADSLEHSQRVIAALFSGADVDPNVSRLHRCRGPNGRDVWLEGKPTLIRNDVGQVVEVVTALRDVTAKREVELALAMSEQRYRSLAENAPDILTESQLDGALTYVSQASLAITGFAPEELVGQSSFSLMHVDDAERMRAMCQTVYQSQGAIAAWPIEFRAVHKSGRPIWLESKPILVTDPATGRYIGLTDVIRDVTARKALEAQLQDARAEAEAAAAVKGEFLANMSHELRTPLTSILGFTRLAIEQEAASGLLRDYIERVDSASQALLATVNDILDFSKLEAGQVDIRPRPINLDLAVKGSLDLFLPQASAKDLDLSYFCERPGLSVSCDPDRLRQILLNLIGNAVKFTAVGGISVSVRYDDQQESVTVEVTDTGAGIPSDKISALFQRFSQIDGSLTRVAGGTGLGLAICKGLVEAMGGQIGVSSRLGVGSCFWFCVPSPVVRETASIDGAQADFAVVDGLRVLVVDDHPTNRELARLILAGLGAETHEARDGAEAIEVAGSQPVDVILMDLRMPKFDGMAALKMIREGDGCNSSTPILAFTADTDDRTRKALLEAGFDGVVSKPLLPEMLVMAVSDALK